MVDFGSEPVVLPRDDLGMTPDGAHCGIEQVIEYLIKSTPSLPSHVDVQRRALHVDQTRHAQKPVRVA